MDISEIEKFIPLDKSWIIRMGVLDLLNGREDIIDFLKGQENLGGDLLALLRVAENWNSDDPLDVGESGTIYRFVRFYLWFKNSDRKIVRRGTLADRKICDDSEIVSWSIDKLLTLDGGTSQWATMAVLVRGDEASSEIPYYLQITFDAIENWNGRRERGLSWEPRKDPTLLSQAEAFIDLIEGKGWNPSERDLSDCDLYCFFRALGEMSLEEGEKKWPHIKFHETNRLEQMEEQLKKYEKDEEIDSKDHRVVQAIVMKSLLDKKEVKISFPEAVNKTWPQFWDFINAVKG
jgi:hypothetical protein